MFAVVAMVKVTVWELVPSSVTLVGLKPQLEPPGRPVQLLEVKLIVWVDPFTGEMVKVTEAD